MSVSAFQMLSVEMGFWISSQFCSSSRGLAWKARCPFASWLILVFLQSRNVQLFILWVTEIIWPLPRLWSSPLGINFLPKYWRTIFCAFKFISNYCYFWLDFEFLGDFMFYLWFTYFTLFYNITGLTETHTHTVALKGYYSNPQLILRFWQYDNFGYYSSVLN